MTKAMINEDLGPMVDAIDDGRIVRVPEKYAIREGLPILRKKEFSFLAGPEKQEVMKEVSRKERSQSDRMDILRRPLKKLQNNVLASLVDNFHWQIIGKRREFGLRRKQVAERISVSENDIKMIENGVLPKDDFVLINKIEQLFGVNLRKEGMPAGKSASFSKGDKLIEVPKRLTRFEQRQLERQKEEQERLTGNGIEIDFGS